MTDEPIRGGYVDGDWIGAENRETFASANPATGETIATVATATATDVAAAVSAAETAQPAWRDRSYVDRARYLWAVHDRLRERKAELGELVTRECGKEIDEGLADVEEAIHMVEWAAGNARHPHGDVVPSELPGRDAYMRRRPRGVVGSITPWNFPIAIPFWHVAVTLVEGNTVVWKPAEQTPRCGEVVAELFAAAGIPDGVFNLVQGAAETGRAVVEDDRVDTVLFTGSAAVGHDIDATLGGVAGRDCSLEMGGKNAVVVTDRADLDVALNAAVLSAFKTTGQRCVSAERLIVHEDVYDEFRDRFVDAASRVAVGDPLDEGTFMGPLIDESAVEKFHEYNALAREEGATVLVDRATLDGAEAGSGGSRGASGDADAVPAGHEAGHWVGPFVYELPFDPESRVLSEEVFGPHVALIPYSGGIERAVEIHDAVDYGLAGAVVSEDYRQLNYYRDHATAGLAYANLPCIGAEVQLPFGGLGKSGKGSPSAREVIEAVTERTAWTVNNDPEVSLAQGLSADLRFEEE
ncbi:aldehyde dehydrogenase family protein [Haloplanus halophilus]|uniref:aldehyde dehydrogenase family protein n=1 Tax=Haloplanus halophilus TaxID=2949993 RepID=UPI00204107AC|nr:aldehyde dehydrogenase family protein [Haloplanus sp. GDY1]